MHDFATGLNYQVDKRTGECKVDFLKVDFDSEPVSDIDGATVLEMKNPSSFWSRNGTDPQYVGQVCN